MGSPFNPTVVPVMPPIFMLLLPAPANASPESHNGLRCLIEHARQAGRSLALDANVLAAGEEGDSRMVHAMLREVHTPLQTSASA